MTENEGCSDPSINEDMDTLAKSIEDNLDTQSLPVFHKIFWEQQVLACNSKCISFALHVLMTVFSYMQKQVIRVKKLVGLPSPALKLLGHLS